MRNEDGKDQCQREKSPEYSNRYCTPPSSPQECPPKAYKKSIIKRKRDCDDLHQSPSREVCLYESCERIFHESSDVSTDVLDSSSEQVAIPVLFSGDFIESAVNCPKKARGRGGYYPKKCTSEKTLQASELEEDDDSPRSYDARSHDWGQSCKGNRQYAGGRDNHVQCSCERACNPIEPEERDVINAVVASMDSPLCCKAPCFCDKKSDCMANIQTSCQKDISDNQPTYQSGYQHGYQSSYQPGKQTAHKTSLQRFSEPRDDGPRSCNKMKTSCGITVSDGCSPPMPELPSGISLDILLQQLSCPQYRDVTADLTVKVKGHAFKSHRFILAHHSCYFLTLLKQKAGKIFSEVTLRDISPEAFNLVHEWMYTNHLVLDSSNLLDIMHCAQCLEISELMTITLEYLNKLVETPECLLVVHLQAVQTGRKCLVEHTLRLLSIVFRHIICCDDFVHLKSEHLHYLITCNNLNVSCEKEAFDAVLRWICHDLETRKSSAVDLLRCIRFGYMSDQELFECMYSDYTKPIMEIQECRLMVLHGYLYHTSTTLGNTSQYPELVSIPRQSLWDQYNLEQFVQNPEGPHDLLELDERQLGGHMEDTGGTDEGSLRPMVNAYSLCPDIRSMTCPALGNSDKCYQQYDGPPTGSTLPCFPAQAKPNNMTFGCSNQLSSTFFHNKNCGHGDDAGNGKKKWTPKWLYPNKGSRHNKDCPGGGINSTLQCKAVLQAECLARQLLARQAGGVSKFDQPWDQGKFDRPWDQGKFDRSWDQGKFGRSWDQTRDVKASDGRRGSSVNSFGFATDGFCGVRTPVPPRTAPEYSSHNKQFAAHSGGSDQQWQVNQDSMLRQQVNKLHGGACSQNQVKNLDGVIQEVWPNKCERASSCDAKCEPSAPTCRRNPSCPAPEPVLMRVILLGGLNPLDNWGTETAGTMSYVYDCPKNKWRRFCQLPSPRHHAAAVAAGSFIFLVGGCCPAHSCNGQKIQALRTVWCLNLQKLVWERLCDMNHARIHHAMVELNGGIYVIGGQDDCGQILSSMEMLDCKRENWCEVAPLHTPRMGVAAAIFCDAIWVCGGMGSKEREKCPSILKVVEYYCQSTDSWCRMNSLRFPRCFSSLVDYNGILHLVGGVTRISSRKDGVISSVAAVDMYDRDGDEWSYKTGLQVPRHNAVALEADGRMYVIGGITSLEASALDYVECYEDAKNGWHKGIAHLPLPLSGMAGVVANVAC